LAPLFLKEGDEDIVHAHGNMWTNMNKALLAEAGGETFIYIILLLLF
jgi:hypothetical protein